MERDEREAGEMECREDLQSMLPLLPLVLSSTLSWPSQVVESFQAMAKGPDHSHLNSGRFLFLFITKLRHSLSLSTQPLDPYASDGYSLFFDELMSRAESEKWFAEVVPMLATLLLRLPSLLEEHYKNSDLLDAEGRVKVKASLRLLSFQQAGMVLLSQDWDVIDWACIMMQDGSFTFLFVAVSMFPLTGNLSRVQMELIGGLLACAFFCLFPVSDRGVKELPVINFDSLFAVLFDSYSQKQENKIRCIIHYFRRMCECVPGCMVSFERKVLPLTLFPKQISYPKASFWSNSRISLCQFKVHGSGFIEDHSYDALEVDFANKYIGGGALVAGCVQEEIRFMINPELIAGMLFLPSMEDNEAIEIVGVERFSNYSGYASTFRFTGNYADNRDVDCLNRRKTRIIAMDALARVGKKQYKLENLVRETNKAFCAFLDHAKYQVYEDSGCSRIDPVELADPANLRPGKYSLLHEASSSREGRSVNTNSETMDFQFLAHETNVGIVTGNWGCGAFGGDPEIKAIIQWLSASQALRPFIAYYTFGIAALQNLEEIIEWIRRHDWSVGDLWNMMIEYSSQRLNGETEVGFFNWLLPALCDPETQERN